MIHFGFSYIGLIWLFMLFIPNIIWTKNKPKDYEKYVTKENKVLQILERIGEVAVCCCVLVFSDFNINEISVWSIWLLISFMLMILYEIYWIRYFKSNQTMQDFYSSICKIPVAGATLPVCAFFLLGLYGVNLPLMVSTIILGIGHIGIHRNHQKEVSERKKASIFRYIWKGIGFTILGIFLLISTGIVGLKNATYLDCCIHTRNGIDEQSYVMLGGQEQYLHIRGEDVHNPVIVWLHGGPAGPDGYFTYTFSDYLVNEYTFVCWDQRGCGRTYYRNQNVDPDNGTVSFEQAQTDLDELVDYLCTRFNTKKVIIMGHSYGTLLGSQYSINHPEKVSAYIGVGQMVNMESDIYSYEDALAVAKANNEDVASMVEAYETYISNPTLINMLNLRNYVSPYHVAKKESNALWLALNSPYMGINDFRWFMKQLGSLDDYLSLNSQLFQYIQTIDVRDYGLEYQIPVGFISGAEDWITPVKYTEDYVHAITAPKKNFQLLEDCGHQPQYDSPKEFSEILKKMLDDYVK